MMILVQVKVIRSERRDGLVVATVKKTGSGINGGGRFKQPGGMRQETLALTLSPNPNVVTVTVPVMGTSSVAYRPPATSLFSFLFHPLILIANRTSSVP